jgi:hypothetical protein
MMMMAYDDLGYINSGLNRVGVWRWLVVVHGSPDKRKWRREEVVFFYVDDQGWKIFAFFSCGAWLHDLSRSIRALLTNRHRLLLGKKLDCSHEAKAMCVFLVLLVYLFMRLDSETTPLAMAGTDCFTLLAFNFCKSS